MDWTKVSVYTTTEGIDVVTGIMLFCGAGGFEIEDAEDFKELTENPNIRFDYVDDRLRSYKTRETCVSCYFAQNGQGEKQANEVIKKLALLKKEDAKRRFGRLFVGTSAVREEDWADGWKKYFRPIPVGNRLLIRPSWEEYAQPDGRAVLKIDPGSSFGTGQHETTKLCLLMLDEIISGGEKVLDLGCGSGILSVGALILGASFALGVDIDRNATDVALKNARLNGLGNDRFQALSGNIAENTELRGKVGEGYDMITANIVSDVLIEMAPYFGLFVKNGGTLIVSGIISERKEEVTDSIKSRGFSVKDQKCDGGWAAVRFIRTD